MGIFVILAISLNVINGFTGMFSLGHAAFFGIGAYTAAVYMNYFGPEMGTAGFWFHFAVGMAGAVIAAGICGALVAVPCLRLRGDYLAIATLAFGEIAKIVFESFKPEILGGPKGLRVAVALDARWAFFVVLAAIGLVAVIARNVKVSATGRAFLAIRENEIAAQVMGINTAFLKVEAFVLGSALAGLAGGLFAYSRDLIAPSDFGLMTTIVVLLMIVVGGLGSITGAVVGALALGLIDPLVRYLPELLAGAANNPVVVMVLMKIKDNPQMIYALLLIVLIRLRPQGIFGTHELMDLLKRPRRMEENGHAG